LIVNKYRCQKNRNYKVNEKLKLKIIENYKKLNPENISNTTTKNKSKRKSHIVVQRGTRRCKHASLHTEHED